MDEYEKLADMYKPLFDLMVDEHKKVLSYSEMDKIIKASYQVVSKIQLQSSK